MQLPPQLDERDRETTTNHISDLRDSLGRRFKSDIESNGHRDESVPLNPIKGGLTLGAIFAGCHLLWALLILAGWAQPVIDFVFWAHMIKPVYTIKPFDPFAAVTLLLMTFSTGYVLGLIGAAVWNNLRHST